MRKEIYSHWPYAFWLAFYFTLFWLIFGANQQSFNFVFIVYFISIIFAFSPAAEELWRFVCGVRPVQTMAEKTRLLPLFQEVYQEAIKADPKLLRNINLYIQNDMDVNAFAFGHSTLILTRGSIELLSDSSLKGLIAHEFGHFSHCDTVMLLIANVGNILLSVFMKVVRLIANILLFIARSKDPIIGTCFRIMYGIILGIYRFILFIGDLILMSVSREHEFMADKFASKCGFGKELTDVLNQIYQVSISKPESIIEQLRSTHPPLSERIQRLEKL